MAMIRAVQKLTAPMQRRIRLMIGRAVISLVNDAAKMQALQISLLESETRDNVERMQQYGFTSHPHPGAEAIMVSVSGNRDHGVVIAVDDRRYRPVASFPGDVLLYSSHDTPAATHNNATQRLAFTDDGGANYRLIAKINAARLEMKSDNTITVSNANGSIQIAANGNITLTCPTLTINGNTEFNGTVNANGKSIDDTHRHSGVTTGSGQTGTPV